MENLINVLTEIKDWSSDGLPFYLRVLGSKVEELEKLYPDLTQHKSALMQVWLDTHPSPSWELVCYALFVNKDYEALEVVQKKYFKGTVCVHVCTSWFDM